MTLKTWILDLDGIEHTVELEHKYGSGKRSIMVDGQVVFQSSRLIDTLCDIGSTHPIEIAGHSVLVII
ncbi:MAG: hypothetical protein AAGU05_08855, partial [Anaerolineaceae bacterium]